MKHIRTKPEPPIREEGFHPPTKGFAAGAGVNLVLIVIALAIAIVIREIFHH